VKKKTNTSRIIERTSDKGQDRESRALKRKAEIPWHVPKSGSSEFEMLVPQDWRFEPPPSSSSRRAAASLSRQPESAFCL